MHNQGLTDATLLDELLEQGYEFKKEIPAGQPERKFLCQKDRDILELKVVLKSEFFSNEHHKKFYTNEARIGSKLRTNFPRLAGQIDFFYTKHLAVFVYTYFPLGTIKTYFGDQPLNLLQTLTLLKDLYLAIEELRSAGFLHKNMTLENIFVTHQSIKLGGVEFMDDISCPKMSYNYHKYFLNRIGETDPHTISPEVLFNKPCGPKTAVYSLGAILYYLLYKKGHTDAPTQIEVIRHHNERLTPNIPPDLPPDFTKMLRECLRLDMEARMSPYEIKQMLSHLLSYCKNFEDDVRASVYHKRTFSAIKGIELRDFKKSPLEAHPELEKSKKIDKDESKSKQKPKILIDSKQSFFVKRKKEQSSQIQISEGSAMSRQPTRVSPSPVSAQKERDRSLPRRKAEVLPPRMPLYMSLQSRSVHLKSSNRDRLNQTLESIHQLPY